MSKSLVYAGTLGLSNIPTITYACGAAAEYPLDIPLETLSDFSQGPLSDYLIKYYGKSLPIERDTSLFIKTNKRNEYYLKTPANFKLPLSYFEENQPNMECSSIDVFVQALAFMSLDYKHMKPHSEGPVYRIASYHFSSNGIIDIGMRYRRIFHESILAVGATLINKETKKISKVIYNYSDPLKGGPPCVAVRLVY